MLFRIQVCNPRFDRTTGVTVEDLRAAIEEITPFETEEMIMVWNCIPMRLEYKYDVSVIISEILVMLDALTSGPSGSHRASFGSDTFNADWDLSWADGTVHIHPTWKSLCARMEAYLQTQGPVSTKLQAFLAEWKLPLRVIADAVASSQIQMEDDSDYQLLRRIEPAITHFGWRYPHLGPTVPQ